MPLDFPSNPSDGQISGNYVWSTSSGAWKSIPTSKTVSTISSAVPTSATNGDIWIDSNDGSSYYYFDDGTSKQWVELISSGIPATPVSIASGGTGGTSIATAKANLQIPLSHNYLINGAFDFWQRGDTIAQNSKCGADQWYYYYFYAMSQIRITSGLPAGSLNAMRVRSDANGNLVVGVMQVIETKNATRLWGKKVTFSVKVRRASTMIRDLTLFVYKHGSVDQSPSSGSWTSIASSSIPNAIIPTGSTSADWYTASITVDIPSDGTANTLWFEVRASGGMDNGVYYEIAEAQVEEGTVATTFRRNSNSIQAELAACQRYFVEFPANSVNVLNRYFGVALSSGGQQIDGVFPVPMRATPTVLTSSGSSLHSFLYYPSNATTNGTVILTLGANNNRKMTASFSNTQNGGNSLAAIYATGENNNSIWVNAEL